MATSPSSSASTRKSFALTGRSRVLDPRTNAVRPDIADIRLADQVFAPHYVAAVDRFLIGDSPLRAGRAGDSENLVDLRSGDTFELLDETGGVAWGIASAQGLVGYLDAALLRPGE